MLRTSSTFFYGEDMNDALMLLLGTELIKNRQELDRAADDKDLPAEIVGDQAPVGSVADATGNDSDPERSDVSPEPSKSS
jgi:hypothetical protein